MDCVLRFYLINNVQMLYKTDIAYNLRMAEIQEKHQHRPRMRLSEVLAFTEVNVAAVDDVMRNNFDMSLMHRSNMGPGVTFTELPPARSAPDVITMLCRIFPGRFFKEPERNKNFPPDDFESLHVFTGRNEPKLWIIFKSEQILPLYTIHFA